MATKVPSSSASVTGSFSYHRVEKGVTRDSPPAPPLRQLYPQGAGLAFAPGVQSHALPLPFSSSSRQRATSTSLPSMTGSVDTSTSRLSTSKKGDLGSRVLGGVHGMGRWEQKSRNH